MLRARTFLLSLCFLAFLSQVNATAAPLHRPGFSLTDILSYPFIPELVAAPRANEIAFVRVVRGVRNIWLAQGPDFIPHPITFYRHDTGQELTQLTFSPDGRYLVYVRGGDHDANWPVKVPPDPADSPVKQQVAIWRASLRGGPPVKLADGDHPALSARNQLVFVRNHQIWTTTLDGTSKPHQLLFDRGRPGELTFSPDGAKLAFVSARDHDDHSFIAIYDLDRRRLSYLSPSTNRDSAPHWSAHGRRIAFVRRKGRAGPPEPILTQVPHPFSLWVGTVATATARRIWQSPNTLLGSYPQTAGHVNLHWAAGNRLIFLNNLDNWPHLYVMSAAGGRPRRLTKGAYMVEHVVMGRDRRTLIFDANTGTRANDDDRRHLFRVGLDGAPVIELAGGRRLQWSPVVAGPDEIAFITAGAKAPPAVARIALDGGATRVLRAGTVPVAFRRVRLIRPRAVRFRAADGTLIHGQLFDAEPAGDRAPGIVFVHGGPSRQMLLGWNPMDYYANSYALNQYLAACGYKVLSVNYRLSIGYGHAFHYPAHAGRAGASEYQDVLAAARFLQQRDDVDGARIGIWGGSYGGYLTALALARNSDIFKAGVDMHGVHDWSLDMQDYLKRPVGYETGDYDAALKVAFQSSPDASIAQWRSPVLLIQGDDDHNVRFLQSIDLANRLAARHVPYKELIIPNEIHVFLRWHSWLLADRASAAFFARHLTEP
ncbi:MAG: S9 family peptidase [Alphaproteobacteria bacterium]|nr:S9 family peptidase [Alphaproteobacteria bacterium]